MSRLKDFLPPVLTKTLRGLIVPATWKGSYPSWAAARSECEGYDRQEILEKVLAAALKVKRGEAAFERDSVSFSEPAYSPMWLAALGFAQAHQPQKFLHVVDFGGSLASNYFLYRRIWPRPLRWTVIEQNQFVEAGRQNLADENLNFQSQLDAVDVRGADLFVLASVLQYLENPEEFLRSLVRDKKPPMIFIDRTPFHFEDEHRLTVQTVPAHIYRASYPCWFFNQNKLEKILLESYEKILEQDNPGDQCGDFPSVFRGQIWKLRSKI